jgi:hypothetical protein
MDPGSGVGTQLEPGFDNNLKITAGETGQTVTGAADVDISSLIVFGGAELMFGEPVGDGGLD